MDSAKQRAGGETLTPMGIARHPLFTAREKIELLQQIKAEVTGAKADGSFSGFSPEEIDEAVAEVRRGVQDGVGADTVLKGDA